MRKRLITAALALGFLICYAPETPAQIFNTGPAGLARQMPRVYGPYMANRARLKYRQKQNKLRKQRRTARRAATR